MDPVQGEAVSKRPTAGAASLGWTKAAHSRADRTQVGSTVRILDGQVRDFGRVVELKPQGYGPGAHPDHQGSVLLRWLSRELSDPCT